MKNNVANKSSLDVQRIALFQSSIFLRGKSGLFVEWYIQNTIHEMFESVNYSRENSIIISQYLTSVTQEESQ